MWPCQSFQENGHRDHHSAESVNMEESVPYIRLFLRQQNRCTHCHLHLLLPRFARNCFDPTSPSSHLGSSLRPFSCGCSQCSSHPQIIPFGGFMDAF
nr:hypothetical protein Iba_scaffold7560CG0010 [Ipomoea batatas]